MDWLVALVALTAMEIVLGIDNIVFIAVLVERLPEELRPKARTIGLLVALGTRILLLFTLSWLISLDQPLFLLTSLGVPESWLMHDGEMLEAVNGVSPKDLILLAGGLFLIGKSVHEIHVKLEGDGTHLQQGKGATATFGSVIFQVALIDIVFSLDSVITAVGMAKDLWVMVTAIVIAIGVMIVFAGAVSRFVHRHPTVKMLALSFLILIGVMLVAEAVGTHIDKGYIYFAMAFALGVEMLNLRVRGKSRHKPASADATA